MNDYELLYKELKSDIEQALNILDNASDLSIILS